MANVKALQALLPLLDLKTDGANPSELLDTYLPSIDVSDMFLQEQMTIDQTTLLCETGARVTFHTVPESNIWIVDCLSARATTPGATAVGISTWMQDRSNFIVELVDDHQDSTVGFSHIGLAWSTYRGGRPLFALPGFKFGVAPNAASVGLNVEMSVRYKALQI